MKKQETSPLHSGLDRWILVQRFGSCTGNTKLVLERDQTTLNKKSVNLI